MTFIAFGLGRSQSPGIIRAWQSRWQELRVHHQWIWHTSWRGNPNLTVADRIDEQVLMSIR
jgi:hypothetical protein